MINFSVIIPNYNHASFLKQRIESVLSQTLQPFEIIILDDGSSDESRSVIEEYRSHPKVSHIEYGEKNSGSPFTQWSKGVNMASAGWIWIAESDDIAEPDFLESAQESIAMNPGTAIYYCDSLVENQEKKTRFRKFSEAKNHFFHNSKWSADYSNEGETEINESMKWICTVNNASAAIFRKEFMEDIIHKLETFVYHGDWYCELAVATRGRVIYNAHPLNHFRLHAKSFLGHANKLQSKLECFRILEYLYELEFVTEKERLVDFFTLQYLGFGFLTDGYKFGKKLFRSYSGVNKSLSKKVFRSLLRQKLKGKRHRVIFQ